MTKSQAIATIKAVNRHVKKARVFEGGRQWGVDYATWCVTYPHVARVFNEAARIATGREGRFIPRFR